MRAQLNWLMTIVCCGLAWSLVSIACWNIIQDVKTVFRHIKRLHQVPCSKCGYFTNSCYLKCTVNPHIAGSEQAINCRDYQPQSLLTPKI